MDLSKLSRVDMIVGGLGIFLTIDLLFLPWYDAIDEITGGPVSIGATSSPYSLWGVLALLLAVALVADLALERFGDAQMPAIGGSRARTRTALAGGALAFLVFKFLLHTGSVAIGCWLGLIAAVVLLVLCVREMAP